MDFLLIKKILLTKIELIEEAYSVLDTIRIDPNKNS